MAKKHLYQKIQPEIMALLENKVERIRDRFGVVYVPSFRPVEIQRLIPTKVSTYTVKRACQELLKQQKIRYALGDMYQSTRIAKMRLAFSSGKAITPEEHEELQEHHHEKTDRAWELFDLFRRFGLDPLIRRIKIIPDEPVQNVIVFLKDDFDEIEAFLRSRVK